jgi:isopenicillin N synthase-like dioxygenase
MVTEHIPTVDLNDLRSQNPLERALAAEAIKLAFSQFGLVYVSNHGLSPQLMDRFYAAYQTFSARPEQDKALLARPEMWYQRGWTPPNTEVAVLGGQPDFKECYFMSPTEALPQDKRRYPQIYADNVWPEDGLDFRGSFTAVSRALQDAGELLLEGAALALGLDDSAFTSRIMNGPHVTRALRYLPLSKSQVGTGMVWGEEHTDFNMLTLLPGGRFLNPHGETSPKPDNGSGLYLRTRATKESPGGERIAGIPKPGCIVAQVGQQLEIFSGGLFLATPHEITAPMTPGYSRLSMAHFIHTHTDQVLSPIGTLATERALDQYHPPVLAGTYDIKTLVDIGLAPKSALDQLGYRHYDRVVQQRAVPVKGAA